MAKETAKIESLMKSLNKEFGGNILHKGLANFDYERIPFTSPRLNFMTYGGIPMGKLVEFYGAEHSGKTTTSLDIVANYQLMENAKNVVYADLENTLDTVWATKLGVDVDDMFILNPTNQGAESIFEKLLELIETDEVGLVIIDSLGVMVSNQALEKSVEEKTYAGIAMGLTNFSKKAEMLCHKHNCTIIGINQVRDDLNSMWGGTTTTGGKAWKHNTAVRMEFRRGDFFDNNHKKLSRQAENPSGNYVEALLVKSKVCPSNRRRGFYTLDYMNGIDYLYDLVELAIYYGIVQQTGAWFKVVDINTDEILLDKVQGQNKVYSALIDDEQLLAKVEQLVNEEITK